MILGIYYTRKSRYRLSSCSTVDQMLVRLDIFNGELTSINLNVEKFYEAFHKSKRRVIKKIYNVL